MTSALVFALCGAAPQMHRASLAKVVLDGGSLAIGVPRDTFITKHRINYETDEYVIARRAGGQRLLLIIVGGGAYDVRAYNRICLNHKEGWKRSSPHGAEIVLGEPGVNAVSASYEGLSAKDSRIANKIMESMNFRDGRDC